MSFVQQAIGDIIQIWLLSLYDVIRITIIIKVYMLLCIMDG